jgi:catechol 2,3-dioxygenase-like lactoylglutathione lyase family enzyme
MAPETQATANVKQAVPFFMVDDIDRSVSYYVDALGFVMTEKWEQEGKLQWCWLRIGDAALMLQEFWKKGPHSGRPEGKLGQGVSICFLCEDALAIYRDLKSRGVEAKRPFVGNAMWVTSVSDPDGYELYFESSTDVSEETVFSEEQQENR